MFDVYRCGPKKFWRRRNCVRRAFRPGSKTRPATLLAAALLAAATTAARAEPPITCVYVLLGGFVGVDGYLDSNGIMLLAGRIATMPNTWVETYPWKNWVTAANQIWGRSDDIRTVVIGYSGGGSRATWLANSIPHKNIDLLVVYDPSPKWQMQNLPPNVKKAITYQNDIPFVMGLGGGILTGPSVDRYLISEEHALVQFDERLHQITFQAIADLVK
jgi:pimeloyl-ACP methyl ester carboxylesterase